MNKSIRDLQKIADKFPKSKKSIYKWIDKYVQVLGSKVKFTYGSKRLPKEEVSIFNDFATKIGTEAFKLGHEVRQRRYPGKLTSLYKMYILLPKAKKNKNTKKRG